jgi:hypothetical protein
MLSALDLAQTHPKLDATLPLEGRVAKLGSQSRSAAREGVNASSHLKPEMH